MINRNQEVAYNKISVKIISIIIIYKILNFSKIKGKLMIKLKQINKGSLNHMSKIKDFVLYHKIN